MNDEYYQELSRLKNLSSLPSIQKVLDDLINERHQNHQQDNIREPIKRSKAKIQTIYITTGYAWCQNKTTVTLYINFKNANEITKNQYSLNVLARSIELDIFEYKGANHKFRINQLYDSVTPQKTDIKFKKDKIVIVLQKLNIQDIDWPDLRMKSTQNIYNELERYERQYEPTQQDNFDTPFTDSPPTICPTHNKEK